MSVQSKLSVLPSNAITSEDILGKDVLDRDGVLIGIVDRLFLDPESVDVLGFSVDKGFLRDGLMVGKTHIEEITPHAIFLKIRPAYRLKGASVFGVDGGLVGTVHQIALHQESNQIEELVVRVKWRREITITKDVIAQVDENVLLSVPAEDVL